MTPPETGRFVDNLLLIADKYDASDLLIRTGDRIRLRIDGKIVSLPPDKVPPPSLEQTKAMIAHLARDLPKKPDFKEIRSIDFHYSLENVAYFRIHAMATARAFGIVARRLPLHIPSFEDLHLPPILHEICKYRNGWILVAGPTGSGKSTTLASMLHTIIQERAVHIITLEDPIEFRYPTHCKGTVTQREVGTDVDDFEQGLIDAMREAPDIILAGEMRERNVIQMALTAAETGHLVASTVHATTATGTIQRIRGAFPPNEQPSFMERLAESLRAIIVQKLIPRKEGKGRVPALEILVRSSVIKHFLLDWENKAQEIPRALEEGHNIYGTQTFDQHLQQLVASGEVSYEDALANAVYPEDFAMRMGRE